jgi:hypothetical protein
MMTFSRSWLLESLPSNNRLKVRNAESKNILIHQRVKNPAKGFVELWLINPGSNEAWHILYKYMVFLV